MSPATVNQSGWPIPELYEVPPVDGARGPVLVWRFEEQLRSISSAIVGGGVGSRQWILNMTVDPLYSRLDPDVHIADVSSLLGLAGNGIGLLTAVDVGMHTIRKSEGAVACSTVGVRWPVWAVDPNENLPQRETSEGSDGMIDFVPGTINLVCFVEERLSDAALVNAVATITEAKTQALRDRNVPGTGTASDAVSVLCPAGGREDIFGGPRSYWGARLATATYESVVAGIDRQRDVNDLRA